MSNCFDNIREIIEKGFLTQSFKINGTSIKIKNPNFNIFEWADEYSSNPIERNISVIARCIISISGMEFKDFTFELIEELLNSHLFFILSKMNIYANSLMRKAVHSHKYLEAFCYTDESRYLWKAWKARSLFTTHKLDDLNNIQISWVLWNEAEDERLESDKEWEKAFFIASATNPKGVESVQKKWKSKENTENSRREEIVQNAINGLLEIENNKQDKTKPITKKHKSFDDLREEMRRWVAGEEDEHDYAVRSYKDEIQRNLDNMKRQSEEIRKRNKEKRRELDSAITGISLQGLSEEQIKSKIKPYKESNPDINMVNNSVINDFIQTPIERGNLSVEDGLIKDTYKPSSLMDKISQRKPTMEG